MTERTFVEPFAWVSGGGKRPHPCKSPLLRWKAGPLLLLVITLVGTSLLLTPLLSPWLGSDLIHEENLHLLLYQQRTLCLDRIKFIEGSRGLSSINQSVCVVLGNIRSFCVWEDNTNLFAICMEPLALIRSTNFSHQKTLLFGPKNFGDT